MPSLPSTSPDRYDDLSVRLHWVTAALVVLLWGGAQLIDAFPRGEPRIMARSVHLLLGVLLALVMVWRLAWRLTGGRRVGQDDPPLARRIASSGHGVLYLLLLAQIGLGLFYSWVRGDKVFTWFEIPAFDPGNKALRHDMHERHELVANLILVVAGLHAAAALFHHYVLKDGVLRRMRWKA